MVWWRDWYEKEVVEQWGATIDPLSIVDTSSMIHDAPPFYSVKSTASDRHILRDPRWIIAVFVADVVLFVTSVAMTGLMTASTSFVTVVEEEEDAIDLEASIRPLLSPPFPMLLMRCYF
jgi:hypothetical protein